MSESGFSYGKLFIQPRDRHRSIAAVYVAHPPAADAASLGRVFFIAEIQSTDAHNAEILQIIQDELSHSYYGTDDLHIEKAFEKALESTNQRIADLVGDYDTDWLNRCNALAAVIAKGILHLSTLGSINAYLIRGNRMTDILNAAGEAATDRDTVNPLKAFSNIISGDLTTDDSVVFTTASLLDYFSLEKLRRTIIDRHPSQATSQIQSLLSENENRSTFAMAIAHMTEVVADTATAPDQISATRQAPQTYPQSAATTHNGPEESMESLLQKQADTGNILAPSLSRFIRERTAQTSRNFFDWVKLKLFRQSPRRLRLERDLRAHQAAHRPTPAPVAERQTESTTVVDVAKKVGSAGAAITRGVGSLVKRRKDIATTAKSAPRSFGERVQRTITGFQRLPRVSKILVGLAVVVAFLLTQGIYSTATSRFQTQQSFANEQAFSEISQDILKAEAALTYDNTTGAREQLDQAQLLLDSIEASNKEDEAKIAELQQNINTQLDRTRNIVTISDPIVVANLADTTATVKPSGLTLRGDLLHTYDAATKTIYEINHTDNSVVTFPQTDLSHSWLALTHDGTDLLLLASDNSLDVFDTTTDKLSNQSFTLADGANIADTAVYDGRYYLLDIGNSQIYRATGTGNGYGNPTDWKTDDTNFSNGTSLAIDGFIYVLRSDGTMTKMLQGDRQDWSLASLEPALTSASELWTSPDAERLFILDPSQNRVVTFDKDGNFLNQYTAAAFSSLNDLAVDVDANTLYVLSGTTIYAIPLE